MWFSCRCLPDVILLSFNRNQNRAEIKAQQKQMHTSERQTIQKKNKHRRCILYAREDQYNYGWSRKFKIELKFLDVQIRTFLVQCQSCYALPL